MFDDSEGGGKTMAMVYTLIATASLNKVDLEAWLTWVFERIADHKITHVDELMPSSYVVQASGRRSTCESSSARMS